MEPKPPDSSNENAARRSATLSATDRIRQWIAVSCLALVVGATVAFSAVAVARLVSSISEGNALVFVGLPIAVLATYVSWRRLLRPFGLVRDAPK